MLPRGSRVQFVQYLTTPELRRRYDVDLLRNVLLAAMVAAGGPSLVSIIFGRARRLAAAAYVIPAAGGKPA